VARLRSLNIANSLVSFAALEAVLKATGGPRLVQLDLSGNDLGDVGAGLLARWPHVASVRDLDLSRNEIGDAGAAALAESPHLTGLRRLALNGNLITEIGKRPLNTSPYLRRISALELRENSTPLAAFRR